MCVRRFFPGGFIGIAREGFGGSHGGSTAPDLPNRATPAQMDTSAAGATGPLPGFGFTGGVAARTRRTVDLPGSRLGAGEHFRSSESITCGSTTRKRPNIDIQLGRCSRIPSLLLFLLLLLSIFQITRRRRGVLLLALLENAPPLRGRSGISRIGRQFGTVAGIGVGGRRVRVRFGVRVCGLRRTGVGYKVKGKKNAVDKELIGREEIGLRERRVSNHPKLKLRGSGESAASSTGGGGGLGRNVHMGKEMKKIERRGWER